jgi:hypothetical protein
MTIIYDLILEVRRNAELILGRTGEKADNGRKLAVQTLKIRNVISKVLLQSSHTRDCRRCGQQNCDCAYVIDLSNYCVSNRMVVRKITDNLPTKDGRYLYKLAARKQIALLRRMFWDVDPLVGLCFLETSHARSDQALRNKLTHYRRKYLSNGEDGRSNGIYLAFKPHSRRRYVGLTERCFSVRNLEHWKNSPIYQNFCYTNSRESFHERIFVPVLANPTLSRRQLHHLETFLIHELRCTENCQKLRNSNSNSNFFANRLTTTDYIYSSNERRRPLASGTNKKRQCAVEFYSSNKNDLREYPQGDRIIDAIQKNAKILASMLPSDLLRRTPVPEPIQRRVTASSVLRVVESGASARALLWVLL